MKYTLHFVRYSLLFFVISELLFALILFVSAGFDIYSIIHRDFAINLITIICTCLISGGCGYYIASFLIFHHKLRCVMFVVSVAFAMLALKAGFDHVIFRRMESLFSVPPLVTMIVLFVLSHIFMLISISAQIRHNLIIFHSDDAAAASGASPLFM